MASVLFETLAYQRSISYFLQMLILLIDVELVVDVRDLKQLGEGRSTLLRCAAGMLGMVAF